MIITNKINVTKGFDYDLEINFYLEDDWRITWGLILYVNNKLALSKSYHGVHLRTAIWIHISNYLSNLGEVGDPVVYIDDLKNLYQWTETPAYHSIISKLQDTEEFKNQTHHISMRELSDTVFAYTHSRCNYEPHKEDQDESDPDFDSSVLSVEVDYYNEYVRESYNKTKKIKNPVL